MGRARWETPSSHAERKCRWQQKNKNKDMYRMKKRTIHAQKSQKSYKELKIQQKAPKVRQALSRGKSKISGSKWKLQGIKLNYQSKEQKEQEENKILEKAKTSTEQVQNYQ